MDLYLILIQLGRPATQLEVDNVAAVLVTAELPAFAKPGQKIDINVSTIGVAESLRGGTLVVTPLRGVDGEVYAIAQGQITVTGRCSGCWKPSSNWHHNCR